MTAQSGRGQGDEPLYEGVVLPSNGEPWTVEEQRRAAQSALEHTQPPAGQPWGEPWGPDSAAAPPPAEPPESAPHGGDRYGTGGSAAPAPASTPSWPDPSWSSAPAVPGSWGGQGWGGQDDAGPTGTGAGAGWPQPADAPSHSAPSYGAPSQGAPSGAQGWPTPEVQQGQQYAAVPPPPATPPPMPPNAPPMPGHAPPQPQSQQPWPQQDQGQHLPPTESSQAQQPSHTPYAPEPGAPQLPPQSAGQLPSARRPMPEQGAYGQPLPDAGAEATQALRQPAAWGSEATQHLPPVPDQESQRHQSQQAQQQGPPQEQGQPQHGQVEPRRPQDAHGSYGQPLPEPSAADADATRHMPPVSGQPLPEADAAATQALPPQQAPQGSGSGQWAGHGQDAEATAMMRTPLPPESAGAGGGSGASQGGRGAHAAGSQPFPAQAPPPPPSSPYGIRPGTPGTPGDQPQHHAPAQGQPPAGFENLYRGEPDAAAGVADGRANNPGSTQSLPLFEQAAGRQQGNFGHSAGPGGPGGPAAGGYGGSGRQSGHGTHGGGHGGGRSRMSPPLLIGSGIAAVAVLGVVAGALFSGGGEEEGQGGDSASSAAKSGPVKSDPAEKQSQELDRLLDDSNNSRTAVIRSVDHIKTCQKLDSAAKDLRGAAAQRNTLVTRLNALETAKVPAIGTLKPALIRAWKSSAAADSHYAAWADEVAAKGKKGCRKGKAKPTKHAAAGNTASGQATAAKKEAAATWNPTAEKYGLKARQFGQL